MRNKKYKIRKDLKNEHGYYRIQAVKDFGDVKKGELGGHIESYRNLSQDGNCWVYPTGYVSGNAKVLDDAKIIIDSDISGNSIIKGSAEISFSCIYGSMSIVSGKAKIKHSRIYDSWVCDSASLNNCMIGTAGVFGGRVKLKDYDDNYIITTLT